MRHRFPRAWKKELRDGDPHAVDMVGGIGHKREDASGQTAMRDYLDRTVSFDRDMVDGSILVAHTYGALLALSDPWSLDSGWGAQSHRHGAVTNRIDLSCEQIGMI
jgi:hypothetical protein